MTSKTYLQKLRKLTTKSAIIEEGKFILQGEKCVEQLLNSTWDVEIILASEKFFNSHKSLIENSDIEVCIVSSKILESLGNFSSNDSAVAVVKCKNFKEKITESSKLILCDINNPGNLGTIIRTADWFGIREIVCSENSVYSYNPKVLQASMGSFLNVEVSYTNLETYLTKLKIPIYAADLDGENLKNCKTIPNLALILGSESHGIPQELKKFIAKTVTIPSDNKSMTESLNVGIAAGIICNHFFS